MTDSPAHPEAAPLRRRRRTGGDGAAAESASNPPDGGSAFRRAIGRTRGYDSDAVDAFLDRARAAFDGADDAVDSRTIREAGFPLVRGGYDVPTVDAALARVEDAFAAREREHAVETVGPREWVNETKVLAQEILDRLSRDPKRRFRRVGFLRFGYRIDEVDIVSRRIATYLQSGEGLSVEQVRSVAFRMQRRGYSERQVDALLDGVVDVMLAVR